MAEIKVESSNLVLICCCILSRGRGRDGRHFVKKVSVDSSSESFDMAIAKRLWKISQELIGQNP